MYQKVLTARTAPVVTPELLAAFGRFDVPQSSPVSNDYLLLQLFIEAATDQVETIAATACLKEQVLLTLDFFPNQQDPRNFLQYELSYAFATTPLWWYGFQTKDSIELVRRPVLVPTASPVTNTVTITYNDPDGVVQTFDSSNYKVQYDKICLNINSTWPQTDRRQDCIQISYWCGNTDTPANVDSRLRMAVLYLANHFWTVRDIVAVEPTSEIYATLCMMLSSYRSFRIPR